MAKDPLYQKLFKVGRVVDREPLENFLTEVFADLMARLARADPEAMQNFVREVLLGGRVPETFDRTLREAERLEWQSQPTISTKKRPDIVVYTNAKPLLIIENKVDAPVSKSVADQPEQEEKPDGDFSQQVETANQLQHYGKWLKEHNPAGALIFLTHTSRPPDDFKDSAEKYGVQIQRVSRWTDVHRWLHRRLKKRQEDAERVETFLTDRPTQALTDGLTEELLRFLEVNHMGIPDIDDRDLSALDLFLAQSLAGKTSALFGSIREEAKRITPNYWREDEKFPLPWLGADRRYQVAWDWIYSGKEEPWFVGWGFFVGDGLSAYGIPSAGSLQAFVLMGTDNPKPLILDVTETERADFEGQGWKIYDPEDGQKIRILKRMSANSFLDAQEGFGNALSKWILDHVKTGNTFLAHARERSSKPSLG